MANPAHSARQQRDAPMLAMAGFGRFSLASLPDESVINADGPNKIGAICNDNTLSSASPSTQR
jgi:hypothetical protein